MCEKIGEDEREETYKHGERKVSMTLVGPHPLDSIIDLRMLINGI